MALELDNVAMLPDGRSIGYSVVGDPAGLPVLAFPDCFGSRLDLAAREFESAAAATGARLISLERPGIGLSDPRPGGTILDWPVDVVAVAEALGLSRFSLVGFGGGGAYALACGLRIPHRLKSVGVVGSPVPPGVPGAREVMSGEQRTLSRLAQYVPFLLERRVRQIARLAVIGSERLIEQQSLGLADVDRAVLQHPARRAHRLTSLRGAFRKGERGVSDDLSLVYRPWGFSLADIPMVVNLWFGGRDVRAAAAGNLLTDLLTRCEARIYPDEGSLSLVWHRLEGVLHGLVATAEREAGRPVG